MGKELWIADLEEKISEARREIQALVNEDYVRLLLLACQFMTPEIVSESNIVFSRAMQRARKYGFQSEERELADFSASHDYISYE